MDGRRERPNDISDTTNPKLLLACRLTPLIYPQIPSTRQLKYLSVYNMYL
jgi:hypothetical protein